MSRNAKKSNAKYTYANINARIGDSTFGIVYESMLKSEAYKSLSAGEKIMYVCCRTQATSKDSKMCLYNHAKEFGTMYSDNDFVFPATHMEKYGFDRSNGGKLLNSLIAKGFLDKKEANKPRKKVNVYSFSSRWKS